MFAEQLANGASDQVADCRWCRRRPRDLDLGSFEFLAVQVGEKKMNGIRGDLCSNDATPLTPEAEYVRGPSSCRIALANRLHKPRRSEMSYHIGHCWRT